MASTFRRFWFVLLALALASLLAMSFACGGDDDDGGDDGGETAAPTTPADNGDDDDDGDDDGDDDDDEVTFDVSMGDNFYEPNEFTVPAGATVTFNLSNDGAAIHNMRVAGADNEFNTDDDAVSEPALVPGGETATVTWTAPDEPGTIDLLCDFHPTDMTGTITVE